MKFRKKPVIIDAWKWDCRIETCDEMTLAGLHWLARDVQADGVTVPYLRIETLEGPNTVYVGDWIIKGIKGEFYRCQPDIFEATYEAVE